MTHSASTDFPQHSNRLLRLGTRGSLLARAQSQLIARDLQTRFPGLRVELTIFKTSGDRITDRPLHEFGGKGLFTKELEQALLDRQVDFVVHSFKDVPVTMPLVATADLVIAATPPREDPRDVLVSRDGYRSLGDLPSGARVGTGSLRRRCQILAARPDVAVEGLRGNIDTRLRKLRDGEYDAVVLATAGVVRAGLFDPALMSPSDDLISAPGQGALALQCRRDALGTREVLSTLHDHSSGICVGVERQVVAGLNGDCHSPIAALAIADGHHLSLRACVGGRDGVPPVVKAAAAGPLSRTKLLVDQVLQSLQAQGAMQMLSEKLSD
jgi:hydroxymethylbilane synthase